MATTDKRELLLVIKGDDKASGPLKKVGDAADGAKDDLSELNVGLKKLDDSTAEATESIAKLRKEIAATGDLELVKDIAKQEQRLKAFAKQRKLLMGDDDRGKPGAKLALPDIDASAAGVGIAAKLGPVIVKNLPAAMSSGGGIGAAVGAPIVLGVAAWLATAANGAILGAAAAGAVAGGIKIAAKDARVQAAGTELSTTIGDQLKDAAAPFVPATLEAIGAVRVGFEGLDDDLEDIFGRSAGYVRPLTDGLMGLARGALPGVRDAIRGAAPVVAMLRKELPELGDTIGDSLSGLAKHGPEAARALGMVLNVAGAGIKMVSQSLEIASTAFKYADIFASTLKGPAEFGKTVAGYQIAAEGAKTSTSDWTGELDILAAKTAAAASEVETLAEMVDRLTTENLSAENSAIALEEAIDGATARAKEGAKGIDINTASGRENRKALLGIAEAAKSSAADILELTGLQDLASESTERGRAAFLRSADAMGVSKKEAIELANRLFGLPKKVDTKADFKPDNKGVSDWKKTLSGIPRNVLISARFRLLNSPDVAMALRLGRLSAGGPVEGPGPKGVDSQPYLLAPGEYVLSAKDVDKLGGTSRIDAWREDLHQASRPAAVAGSGTGGGGRGGSVPPVVINAAGASGLDRVFLSWLLGAIRNAGGRPSVLGL